VLGPTDILIAIVIMAVVGPAGAVAVDLLLRRLARPARSSKERT
jgi:hypothetical protein